MMTANLAGARVQPVHWQSAFWALATIALNNALQDSGEVLRCHPKYRMALRTSPIICLFDSVDTLVVFACHCRHFPPIKAVELVARKRLADEPASKGSKFWLVNWIVLIVAIAQFVKVFSFGGMLWVQLFAGCYLASFICQEIVNQFGRREGELLKSELPTTRPASPRPQSHLSSNNHPGGDSKNPDCGITRSYFLGWVLPLMLQVALWAWLLGVWDLPSPPRDLSDSFMGGLMFGYSIMPVAAVYSLVYTLWVTLVICCLLIDISITVLPGLIISYLPIYLLRFAGLRIPKFLRSTMIAVITIAVAIFQTRSLGGMYVMRALAPPSDPLYSIYIEERLQATADAYEKPNAAFGYRLTVGGSIVGVAVIFSLGAVLTTDAYFPRNNADGVSQPRVEEDWAPGYLVLMNIASAVTYYCARYEENGTFKPGWAENLG